jgi:polyphosphate kinase
MMHRNLDRRVEVLVKLPSSGLTAEVGQVLDLAFDPGTAAWELGPDGTWTAAEPIGDQPLVNLQDALVASHHRRR